MFTFLFILVREVYRNWDVKIVFWVCRYPFRTPWIVVIRPGGYYWQRDECRLLAGKSEIGRSSPGHLKYRGPHRGTEPFRSRANSLPGANRPIGLWPIRSLANSLPGLFDPWPFRSLELSPRGPFAPHGQNHYLLWKKFIQRNQSSLKHAVERAT